MRIKNHPLPGKDKQYNILIIGEGEIYRRGIQQICLDRNDTHVSVCDNLEQAIVYCNDSKIDVVIINVMNKQVLPIEALEARIRKLAITHCYEFQFVAELQKKSLNGIVAASICSQDFTRALDVVINEGFVLCRKLKTILANQHRRNVLFSNDELAVIKQICKDLSSKEISVKLAINTRTIDSIRTRLFKKTNVKSIAGLAIYAIQNNLLD